MPLKVKSDKHFESLLKEIKIKSEERFEDYTNVTPWESFITDLQLIIIDWGLKTKSGKQPASGKTAELLKMATLKFQAMEFKLEHVIVASVSNHTHLDREWTSLVLVEKAYGLNEFLVLSPADPDARRLVGSTRLRLLLSSVELALAEHQCTLPILVRYGMNKFYYGLSLSSEPDDHSLIDQLTNVLVPETGMKKTEFSMAHFWLPSQETHLLKLQNIFQEQVGLCDEVIEIAATQYFRVVKLSFVSNDHIYGDENEFPMNVFEGLSFDMELNVIVHRPIVHPTSIEADPTFSSIAPKPYDEWYLDPVILEVSDPVIEETVSTLFACCQQTSNVILKHLSDVDCHLSDLQIHDHIASIMFNLNLNPGEIPSTYFQSSPFSSSLHLDQALFELMGCCPSRGGLLTRVCASLYWLVKETDPSSSPQARLSTAWKAILSYLSTAISINRPVVNAVTSSSLNRKSGCTPLERCIDIFHQHVVVTKKKLIQEGDDDDADEFFDVQEVDNIDNRIDASKHTNNEMMGCIACLRGLEDLSNIPLTSVAECLIPYLLLYQLQLLHRLDLPAILLPWHIEQLNILRINLSENKSNNSVRMLLNDFNHRLIAAVSAHALFSESISIAEPHALKELATSIGERVHFWSDYPASKSFAVQAFNIQRLSAIHLSTDKLRSCIIDHLTSFHYKSSTQNDSLPISAHRGTLFVNPCSLQSFPNIRVFLISPKSPLRRPNPLLSRACEQRLFVSMADRLEDYYRCNSPSEKLRLIECRNDEVKTETDGRFDLHADFIETSLGVDIFIGGVFGKDCTIY